MFIPRSAARVRLVRVAFVLLAALPAAGLAAWAVHLRSAAHRRAVERGWERKLGLPVAVGRVEYPRPGVVRVRDCVVTTTDGAVRIAVPSVEVETTAQELRVRIEQFGADASTTRVLADLAGEWLARGPRYDRNCVVEVADFTCLPALGPPQDRAAGLRVECVATVDARAIRIVRPVGGERPAAELRVVRTAADTGTGAGTRTDVLAELHEPVPWDVLAALAGMDERAGWSLGAAAVVTGKADLWHDDRGWHGEAGGRIQRIDLAACAAAIDLAATGEAILDLRSLRLAEGRLLEAEMEWHAGSGTVARRFVDALIAVVGCRPGPGLDPTQGADACSFDAAGALVRVHGGGVELLAGTGLQGALALAGGREVAWPPPHPVAAERLAWVVAPPASPSVPAGGPGAWLLSVLPRSGVRSETGRVERPRQPAGAVSRPREF